MDSKNRIARSNIYTIFGGLLARQISSNEDYQVILAKAGLKDIEEKYSDYLKPYWYNKGYRNTNESFNPQYACLQICEEIEGNQESLITFFNTILSGTKEIDDALYYKLENYLNEIGYELRKEETEEEFWTTIEFTLMPSTQGTQSRNKDNDYLLSTLEKSHPDLVTCYNEALTNYGSGQYRSCVDNCRSLFEGFFKKLDTVDSDYAKGILSATRETVTDNGVTLTSKKKIFTYWFDHNSGANRYRLFMTMYSVMSGLGTHREDACSQEDALLLLRFTEDTILWCFRKGINC